MTVGQDLDQALASLAATDETIAAGVAQLATELLALEARVAALEPSQLGLGSARFWELPTDVQDGLSSSRTFHPDCPENWVGHKASGDPSRPGFVHALSIRPKLPADMVAFMADVNEQARQRPDELFIVIGFHEPEDNINDGFTFDQYHTIQRAIHQACVEPNVQSSVCLMAWTFTDASGLNPHDYVTRYDDGSPAFDVLGIDMYDPWAKDPFDDQVGAIEAWRDEHLPGVELGMMEFSTHTVYHRVPRYGRPETWPAPKPIRDDEIEWTGHVLDLTAEWVCAIWFNSWVGGKGPWWMPDTIQTWVSDA